MVVFAGIGILIVFVLKQFVPEFYELLSSFGSDYEPDIAMEGDAVADDTDEIGDESRQASVL